MSKIGKKKNRWKKQNRLSSNIDVVGAQMSKVHSHYGNFSYNPLSNIIFGDSKTNVFTFDVLNSVHQLGR